MIKKLKPNQIFVFGSNKYGHHLGGAAKQAYKDFGAVWGMGWGIYGQSYAFPTLGYKMEKLSIEELETERDNLYECAERNTDKDFLLTPVGTGIAGYEYSTIERLFNDLPLNIRKVGWHER